MKTMKFILALLMVGITMTVSAQSAADRLAQRAQVMKANKKLQDVKVSKESRKLVKQLKKEGWKVAPGALSMEQQFERSALLQNQFEEDLITPKYVWGDAQSQGSTYDAAKLQALELARANLIASLETNITRLTENSVDNQQLANGEAVSITKMLSTSKSIVSSRLGQTTNVVEVYRELANGNYIVRVVVFYSMDKARDIALDAVREQMAKDRK